jgi:hypothetical protein
MLVHVPPSPRGGTSEKGPAVDWSSRRDHPEDAASEGEAVILARFAARVTKANSRVARSMVSGIFAFL